ncbi:hypothetical protein BUALT_Bualt03G0098900 [Buddleja alternifolia]|uniref:Ribosomal protein L16 n=1 Tax=Buddleja alternifolia TaxID=168488 RepID=A0AAV6XZU9_9LAMI|nr:hypothetical protein BUALT_Bualt03G0098900 [Buddleja alternifolia]
MEGRRSPSEKWFFVDVRRRSVRRRNWWCEMRHLEPLEVMLDSMKMGAEIFEFCSRSRFEAVYIYIYIK